jgi:hypothetical protein
VGTYNDYTLTFLGASITMDADRSKRRDNPMPALTNIQQLNRDLADKLVAEAKQDPQSPYAGKKVGIANGQVVVVADTWREVAHQLRQAEPDPAKTFCIEVGADYTTVQEVWEAS